MPKTKMTKLSAKDTEFVNYQKFLQSILQPNYHLLLLHVLPQT